MVGSGIRRTLRLGAAVPSSNRRPRVDGWSRSRDLRRYESGYRCRLLRSCFVFLGIRDYVADDGDHGFVSGLSTTELDCYSARAVLSQNRIRNRLHTRGVRGEGLRRFESDQRGRGFGEEITVEAVGLAAAGQQCDRDIVAGEDAQICVLADGAAVVPENLFARPGFVEPAQAPTRLVREQFTDVDLGCAHRSGRFFRHDPYAVDALSFEKTEFRERE